MDALLEWARLVARRAAQKIRTPTLFVLGFLTLQQVPFQLGTVQRKHPVALRVGKWLSGGQPALPPRLIDFLF